MTNAEDLLRDVGLAMGGTVQWGNPVPSPVPGIYIISTPAPMAEAPIEIAALRAWIHRLPQMRIDGRRPTAATLNARLRSFWVPGETVVYIGLAGTSLASRVRQFYGTPLGNRAPHAGGHWLKTLRGIDAFQVTWAASATPGDHEDALLRAFARALPRSAVAHLPRGTTLPFANLETGDKVRKPHGITGSRVGRISTGAAERAQPDPIRKKAGPVRARTATTDINAAIQRLACAHPDRRVTAVEAGAELDRLGLLRDSPTRRGKPLRVLLREGVLDHAYQEGGRLWFIDCATRNGDDSRR